MRRAVLGAVALLVLVALLMVLTGCGGDPKSDPSPSPSTPATSPVSTTPSAPVMPEEAKADTKAGAVAFVKYYIEEQNFATQTGATTRLRELISPKCSECLAVPNFIDVTYEGGGRIEGEGWEVLAAAPIANPPGPTDMDYINVSVRIHDQRVFAEPTSSPSQYAGESRRGLSIGLTRSADHWLLSRILVVQS